MKHKHITAAVRETYHILGHEPILESFQEYICQLPKISNGICIFQTYLENNAWLHYLILLNSFTLLKHQFTCLHIQEIQLKSFVYKKDCHSLKGMIDMPSYQTVYNIKIIYDIYIYIKINTTIFQSTIFLYDQPKKKYKMIWSISTKSPHLSAMLSWIY